MAQRLDAHKSSDGAIMLVTHHYYQMTPSSATPILVGFLNDLEKDNKDIRDNIFKSMSHVKMDYLLTKAKKIG